VQKGRCFDHLLYSDRWYNPTFYCEEVLDFRDSGAFPSANMKCTAGFLEGDGDDDDDDDDAESMDGGIFDSNIEGEVDVDEEGDIDSVVAFQPVAAAYEDEDEDENVAPVTKITYGEVVEQCIDLVKMVQSEQAGLRMVYSIMARLVDCFLTGDVPSVTIEHVPREEVRALTTVAPNGANIKRKLSAQEARRKKRQKNGSARSVFEDNTDANAVPPIRNRTWACRLCCQGGHGKFKCPLGFLSTVNHSPTKTQPQESSSSMS
jgi:hypothetical protein